MSALNELDHRFRKSWVEAIERQISEAIMCNTQATSAQAMTLDSKTLERKLEEVIASRVTVRRSTALPKGAVYELDLEKLSKEVPTYLVLGRGKVIIHNMDELPDNRDYYRKTVLGEWEPTDAL